MNIVAGLVGGGLAAAIAGKVLAVRLRGPIAVHESGLTINVPAKSLTEAILGDKSGWSWNDKRELAKFVATTKDLQRLTTLPIALHIGEHNGCYSSSKTSFNLYVLESMSSRLTVRMPADFLGVSSDRQYLAAEPLVEKVVTDSFGFPVAEFVPNGLALLLPVKPYLDCYDEQLLGKSLSLCVAQSDVSAKPRGLDGEIVEKAVAELCRAKIGSTESCIARLQDQHQALESLCNQHRADYGALSHDLAVRLRALEAMQAHGYQFSSLASIPLVESLRVVGQALHVETAAVPVVHPRTSESYLIGKFHLVISYENGIHGLRCFTLEKRVDTAYGKFNAPHIDAKGRLFVSEIDEQISMAFAQADIIKVVRYALKALQRIPDTELCCTLLEKYPRVS